MNEKQQLHNVLLKDKVSSIMNVTKTVRGTKPIIIRFGPLDLVMLAEPL